MTGQGKSRFARWSIRPGRKRLNSWAIFRRGESVPETLERYRCLQRISVMKSTLFLFMAATVLLLGMTACAPVGIIASPNQSAADQRTIALPYALPPTTSFVDGALAVGKELGYQVGGVSRTKNEVLFTRQSNFGLGVLIGKADATTVRIRLDASRRAIDIAVNMTGNFNTANQTAADKIIADFAASLKKQFAA